MYTEIPLKKIDTDRLVSVLKNHIDDVDANQTTLTDTRRKSLEAYRGKYPGPDKSIGNGSNVVSRDVEFAVNSVAPEIVKVFLSSKNPLKFVAYNETNQTIADTVTDYVAKSFEKHGGYNLLQTYIRNALLLGAGVIKTTWIEQDVWTFESYQNIDQVGLASITDQPDVEIDGEPVADDESGLITVKVKKKSTKANLKFEAIAPENLLCTAEMDTLDECRFVSERNWVTKNDLLALGYDKDVVDELKQEQKDTAYDLDNQRSDILENEASSIDNDRIEYYESYLHYEIKEGEPEQKIKVCHTEDVVLAVYNFEMLPYSLATATNIPNSLYGMSLAEQVIHIQELKTVLLRQSANAVYQNNFPRQFLDVTNITPQGVEKLKTPKFGDIINLSPKKVGDTVTNPLFTTPTTSNLAESMSFIQHLDQKLVSIMGVNPVTNGIASDVISNRTATEVAQAQAQADTALVSYIRNIAEGLKDAFVKALWLSLYYDVDDTLDYSINDFEIQVAVGLGANDDQRQLQALGFIAEKQQELVEKYGTDSPFVNESNILAVTRQMAKLSGVDNPDVYLPDVGQDEVEAYKQAKQEQATNAEQQAVIAQQQAQQALEEQKTAAKLAEIQLKREQLAFEVQKHQDDMEFKKNELAIKSNVELTTLEVTSSIEEAKLDLKDQELKTEAELKQRSIDSGQSTSTNIGIR